MQSGAGKVAVWYGRWSNRIVGPVLFDTDLNANAYQNKPRDNVILSLLNKDSEFPRYILSRTGHTHYGICVGR